MWCRPRAYAIRASNHTSHPNPPTQSGLSALLGSLHESALSVRHPGQYFRAGGTGAAIADVNARHGNEPGVSFYTHVSDQFGPFYTKVIASTASEAPHVHTREHIRRFGQYVLDMEDLPGPLNPRQLPFEQAL